MRSEHRDARNGDEPRAKKKEDEAVNFRSVCGEQKVQSSCWAAVHEMFTSVLVRTFAWPLRGMSYSRIFVAEIANLK